LAFTLVAILLGLYLTLFGSIYTLRTTATQPNSPSHHHHHHHHHHHDDEDSHNWVPLLLAMVQNFAVLVRQPGMVHRATNLTGCFLMMTSNYLAKKRNHSITAIGDNNKDSSGNNNNADNNTNDNSERKGACWDPGCFCFAGYVSSRNWQKHAWKNNMMGL